MNEDVCVLGAGELLLSGPAVLWFATLAERAVHAQRSNGVRNPVAEGWLATSIEAAARVRTAGIGRAAVPRAAVLPSSGLIDPISAQEAAEMMNRKPRNVTDLCARGSFESAQRVAGRWQLERSEVAARVERMAS